MQWACFGGGPEELEHRVIPMLNAFLYQVSGGMRGQAYYIVGTRCHERKDHPLEFGEAR